MSEDQFAAIKQQWNKDNGIYADQIEWLISEIERLRAALHEAEMQSYGQGQ